MALDHCDVRPGGHEIARCGPREAPEHRGGWSAALGDLERLATAEAGKTLANISTEELP